MPVTWDCGECQAYIDAVAALPETDDDSKYDTKDWTRFADLREALIWGLLAVGFPAGSWKITEKNWREVYKRLHIMEIVGGVYRSYYRKDKPNKDVYFSASEVHSMIGLSVNAGNKSKAEFKKMIMNKLEDKAKYRLDTFDKIQKEKERVSNND